MSDEIIVGDVEGDNYGSKEEMKFSHQALIMNLHMKIIEHSSKEFVKGFQQTISTPQGIKLIFREDNRKGFIESVRTLKSIMLCDFDDIITENIKKLEEKEDKIKKEFLKLQNDKWEDLSNVDKNSLLSKYGVYLKNYFFSGLEYYGEMFILEQINIYRKIFEELILLTARKDFYKEEFFEA